MHSRPSRLEVEPIESTATTAKFAIEFEERPNCALCGSAERTVHLAFRDIPVVRCSACGFLYSSRTMNATLLETYYRETFGSRRHMQGQIVNARVNGIVLEKLLDLKKIGSWLDVGTGYGFLLKKLHEKWKIAVEGVELSAQEADYARNTLGLKVHSKLLSDAGLPLASFDVVSCFEVIEHIPNPKPFLAELASYVRPGGQLIVMTDNFESQAVRQLKAGFPKWIPHTHVSHFAPDSLRACIRSVPELTLEKEGSYTPWDLVGRRILTKVRPPRPAKASYDLNDALATEMVKEYKLYPLRYVTNPMWASVDFRSTLDGGALMYAVSRKRA